VARDGPPKNFTNAGKNAPTRNRDEGVGQKFMGKGLTRTLAPAGRDSPPGGELSECRVSDRGPGNGTLSSSRADMPEFCDIALPVPLDRVFTYRIPEGLQPVVGGRVLVPFRQQRMSGVVTAIHGRAPAAGTKMIQTKSLIRALDTGPVLDELLLCLGRWIADYYLAPLGEVFRTMLPLAAEFKHTIGFRITEQGRLRLHEAATQGSSARSRTAPAEQAAEFRALDYLVAREIAQEESLRAATRVSTSVLTAMLRKKWIVREDLSDSRRAMRTTRVAVLRSGEGKVNANQRALLETLAEAGGQIAVEDLHALDLPRTALASLVKRGLLEIVEKPAAFLVSALKPRAFEFQFNPAQAEALKRIQQSVATRRFRGLLLHGVTGSGKTAVYLRAMRSVLEAGCSAILLVPEIGLTPAVAADLYQVFGGEVAILHSALSDKERAEQWHRIKRREARVVVGTRSAVFAPVSDLALLIVDEEQDSSYKQAETPRYHARDVAVMRAKISNAVVVLGSATPSLESYFNAKKEKYALLELPDRVEQRSLPEVEIIDMRLEFQETGHEQAISRKLAAEMRERLERKEQVIVLLNRRGYSPMVLCRACGSKMECRNCAVSLTHHKRRHRMECHYCGFMAPVPKVCGECGSEYVYFLGTGSEKLEELLQGMFPQARIGRLDRDTVRGREDFERMLGALNAGEIDLLVGTQMIAKGHDIHGVTLVGVVGADSGLGFPDFRAAERTFQLLTQVAGRAGRGQAPGKVVLQTYLPDHYAVQYAAAHDFTAFYEKELRFRSWMHYPPYSALANVLVRSDKLEQALEWSGLIGNWFRKTSHEGLRVLGPAAAPIIRLKREYRYHFVLKSSSRAKLNAALRSMLAYAAEQRVPRTQLTVDVDAVSLM
jgi:primosomal protein N' (replication factor Y) (superfamily II helicase)